MAGRYAGPKAHMEDGGDTFKVAAGGKLEVDPADLALGQVASVAFTIGAEVTNVRPITLQVKNSEGANLAGRRVFDLGVFADANGDAPATGGSTGIAELAGGGAGGILATMVAKLWFRVITDATGKLELQWTDTGTEAVFLGAVLINGTLSMSASIANT